MARPTFSLAPFGPNEKAIFSNAIELATAQGMIETRPPGHIALEPRAGGGRYAYWIRYGADGKQTREYCGAEGSERHREAMDRLEALKGLSGQAKLLRKLGFEAVEQDAALVLAELHNAGVFAGGGILIGTRAVGALMNHLGYRASPFLQTLDVDIARLHRIRLAVPLPSGGFLEVLKRTGLRFVEVGDVADPAAPPAAFKVVGRNLKVDLLTPSVPRREPFERVPIPELGAHATTLPFLDYLLQETWQVVVLGKDHIIPVRAPAPARYCLHKIAVADLRHGIGNPKIEKDATQAAMLAAVLIEDDHDELRQAITEMPPAMARHALKGLPAVERALGGRWPEVVALLSEEIPGVAGPPRRRTEPNDTPSP